MGTKTKLLMMAMIGGIGYVLYKDQSGILKLVTKEEEPDIWADVGNPFALWDGGYEQQPIPTGTTAQQTIEQASELIGSIPTFFGFKWQPPTKAAPYIDRVHQAERDNGIPHNLLARLIHKESRWNPNAYNKYSGAKGLAQFMPRSINDQAPANPYDPDQAIPAAGRYLKWCYDYVSKNVKPSWKLALAAYNAGVGNVKKYNGIPPFKETQNYVAAISRDIPVS